MKILFITYHFAPYNHIGAIRCAKTAKHLVQSGDQVRVIAAADQPFPADLKLEIDPAMVRFIACPHLDSVARTVAPAPMTSHAGRGGGARNSPGLRRLYELYKTFIWYPDNVTFWRRRLLAAARREIHEFRPDVILASGPPFTPLIVASQLSRESGVPWVCELRDLWTDNHSYRFPSWRRRIERRLEKHALSTAAAFVTVSEPLKATLERRYEQPVHVVTNGFEPEDYEVQVEEIAPGSELAVVYTGFIYRERQDIGPLLEALTRLQDRASVRLHLFGPGMEQVLAMSEALGVAAQVTWHGVVAHERAVAVQRAADLLLFLSWNDPAQTGVLSGKLFEYLGARRPMLCVAHTRNVSTDLITERGAGHVSGSAESIGVLLDELVAAKRRRGRAPDLDSSVGRGFTRAEQSEKLRHRLIEVAANYGGRSRS